MPLRNLTLILSLFFCQCSFANGFFQQPDKQKHIIVSAVGANLLHSFTPMNQQEAFWTMMGIGLLKEVADGNDNSGKEHALDILANTIGSSSVFLFNYEYSW